jgi:formylglycine-generating enzyme
VPTETQWNAPPLQSSARIFASQRFADGLRARPIREQQQYLLLRLEEEFALDEKARERVRKVFETSEWLGFGNPKQSVPAMTQAECLARHESKPLHPGDSECPSRNMVRIPGQGESNPLPGVCIDQFEFPNIACEYPVVWVRASEASELCLAQGKRLCWAHEWEGACAGALLPASDEYPYAGLGKYLDEPSRLRDRRVQLEYLHNKGRETRWAHGTAKDHARCATSSMKSPSCDVVDFSTCGTNDYPAGSFPECVSPLGVYDQHGNAAEHMSLPVYPTELALGPASGWTEMKGSWFVFSNQEAHPDDCRWRAKNWHTTRISEPLSHRNYHLGFRCCADVAPKDAAQPTP